MSVTFESTIQNDNLYFNFLIENLRIALGLVSLPSLHGGFLNFRNGVYLNSRNTKISFPVFKIPRRIIDAQWYSWLLLALRLCAARSAAICQGRTSKRYLTGLVEMGLFPSDCDKLVNSTKKMFPWKLSQGETPISDSTSKAFIPHSIIISKLGSLNHKKPKVVKRYL